MLHVTSKNIYDAITKKFNNMQKKKTINLFAESWLHFPTTAPSVAVKNGAKSILNTYERLLVK